MEQCQNCHQLAPANELAAYRGRCENCFCEAPYNGPKRRALNTSPTDYSFESGVGPEQFANEQRRAS